MIGGLLAAASVKVLAGLLYGVQPMDLPTFVSVGGASIVISLLASLIAASRVVRFSPAIILRQE